DTRHQGAQIATPHAVDHGQAFHVAQSRGAEQNEASDLARVAGRILDGHLSPKAVCDQMVWRRLDEPVEGSVETLHQVDDIDAVSCCEGAVQRRAVVGERVRRMDVEVPAPSVEVAIPTLRLLREAIDEDQWNPP